MNVNRLAPLHKVIVLLLVTLTLFACASEETGKAPTANATYVDGEVLVGLKLETAALHAAVQGELLPGAQVLERMTIGGYQPVGSAARAGVTAATVPALEVLRLQLPAEMAVEDAVAQLSSRNDLLYAEPNYRVRKALVPNDTFFSKQWGLQNSGGTFTGNHGTYYGPGPDIDAASAWDVSSGDGTVIVATIDTGIEYDHPDLAANMWINSGESGNGKETNRIDDDANGYVDDWRGWNFVANNNDPRDDDQISPYDTNPLGHGSHVAGIIGARGNNSAGVSGINWQVQLMPIKFLSAAGDGNIFNSSTAINYAVRNGAKVINASYEYGAPASDTERLAIAAAGDAGVLFVAAAGNSHVNIDNAFNKVYPAAHTLDNIIAVAATDPNGNLVTSFSNYGVSSVDLGAPGLYIYSTVRLARQGQDGLYGYDYMSGTSMAAPMVSGAAALLWGKFPYLTVAEVRQLLLSTVDSSPSLTGMVASGGRLNLGRAMTEGNIAQAPSAPTDLTGVGQTNGALLNWVDTANDETAFIVERSLSAQPFAMVARLAANTTTYTDSTVRDGEIARYQVKAVAGIQSSAYSNIVDVALPLRPPTNLIAYADSQGIHLVWTDASFAETGFKVERREANAATFSEIRTLSVNSTGYLDTDVIGGARYFYRVRSYSATLGDSAYTNEILAQMAGGGSTSKDRRCFIATAAFGTPFAPQVETLRTFRDRVLLTNAPGRLLVDLYYRASPPLANFITGHDLLCSGVRILLRPLVWMAKALTPGEAAAMSARPAQPPDVIEAADVIAGELLVCFRPELSKEAIVTILRAEGSEQLEGIASPQGTLLRIKLAAGVSTAAAQKRFSGYQEVVYAEPNRRVSLRKP